MLPPDCMCYVSIEAGSTFGWHRFIGRDGLAIGLDHFGASAPYKVLAKEFGFTPEGVIERIKDHFICSEEDDDCGCGCEDDDCGCGDCGCEHDHK